MAKVPFDINLIKTVESSMHKAAIDRMDDIAIKAHAEIVKESPVDKGQSRAGWNFTLNRISKKVPKRNKVRVAPPPKSEPDKRAQVIGDRYHISNFVRHTIYLNEGSSDQAPAKFVETAIAKAVRGAG